MEKYVFRVLKAKCDGMWHWKIKKTEEILMVNGKQYQARELLESGKSDDPRTAVRDMRAAFNKYR